MPSRDRAQRQKVNREYYWRNRERCLERQRKYRAANRRVFALSCKHGLSMMDARALVDAMPAGCAVCGGQDVQYDHDHATGMHRGWLCGLCNRGIGNFRDNPTLLRNAAAYLEAQPTPLKEAA